jgi:hypothetical protein
MIMYRLRIVSNLVCLSGAHTGAAAEALSVGGLPALKSGVTFPSLQADTPGQAGNAGSEADSSYVSGIVHSQASSDDQAVSSAEGASSATIDLKGKATRRWGTGAAAAAQRATTNRRFRNL